VPHIRLSMYNPQPCHDAMYEQVGAHDQVALFPASFTFMIKARTKMDKVPRWRGNKSGSDESPPPSKQGEREGPKYARLHL